MTITPNMTDAEKIDALQEYIMNGTEMVALQEIVDLSSANPSDPLYTIHSVAVAAINKIRPNDNTRRKTMTTQTYTDQQLSDWKLYEKVRKSGKWNMFFPQARAATGLSSERYLFVMQHFSELKEAVEAKSANAKLTGGVGRPVGKEI